MTNSRNIKATGKFLFRHIAAAVLALVLFCAVLPAKAQEDYRFAIGGGLGMTGYLGDANTANLLKNPGFDGELLFRYIANPRINWKTGLYVGTLRGNSAQMTNVFPEMQTFKFSSTVVELSEAFEFHFFNYGMGERYRKLKRWTPYITAGFGFNFWTVSGQTGFSALIPMGVGVKYKLSERWNLDMAFLMKKSFSDRLDGDDLRDPYLIKSSFMKNTDWYSTLNITVSYEFSKRCAVCNYKE